jgi:hypothetical protein
MQTLLQDLRYGARTSLNRWRRFAVSKRDPFPRIDFCSGATQARSMSRPKFSLRANQIT